MSVLVQKFLTEPVFALGILSALATGLVAQHVISGLVAILVVGVITAAQRQLVTPAKKRKR